jgi:hypothetical protein
MQASERERVTASLTLHAPELAGRDVFPLGKGLDNTVFLVDDLVLRASEEHSVVREARLLEIVASSVSVPVPVPRFADEDRGVLAYQLLAGRPLLGWPPFAGLARRLGAFLRDCTASTRPASEIWSHRRTSNRPRGWRTSTVLRTSSRRWRPACRRRRTSGSSRTPTWAPSTCWPSRAS